MRVFEAIVCEFCVSKCLRSARFVSYRSLMKKSSSDHPPGNYRCLALKKYPNGKLRPYWYGDFMVNGKRRVTTLCRFEGRPPSSGSAADFGDKAFELSRADAITTLNNLIDWARTVAARSATIERIIKIIY